MWRCKLRWLLIIGLLAASAPSAEAARHLTVAQLERWLAADVAAHKRDRDVAKQILNVTLTERIPTATFAHLNAQLNADPEASLALRLLADQSEFLDLPASEAIANPPPVPAAQTRMLESARNYVALTLRRLPNFLATRTIDLYDDTPHALKPGGWPTRAGLHLIGASQAEISVTREREDQPPAQGSAVWQSKIGLVSGGEFGTTLGMILNDAASGRVSWSHWEQLSGGIMAVFSYEVPASASHFEVISSFQREADLEAVRGPANARGIAGMSAQPNISSSNVALVRTRPAYHGLIWLNPADGAIYRITMEADTDKALPFRSAAILVEYGPVDIAGSTFICPVRSLALSQAYPTAETITGDAATEWLNETLFTNYHRFGSSSRIVANVTGESRPPAGSNAADASPSGANQANLSEPPQPAATPAPPPDQTLTPSPANPPAPPTTGAQAQNAENEPPAVPTPAPNAPPAAAEKAPPAQPPASLPPAPAQPGGFTFHVNVDSLLIPTVVLDKDGHAIGGLSKEDFQVIDDRQHRPITGFTLVHIALPVSPTDRKTEPVAATQPTTSPGARRFLIFLFDDRHITAADLSREQKAAIQLFDQPLPATDYAAVLSFMGVNSGITRDRATLQSAVMKLTVHQAFQQEKEDCPKVDYYAADQIINQRNPMEFQIAVQEAKQCTMSQYVTNSTQNLYDGMDNPTDPFQRAAILAASHAIQVGEEDARETLFALRNVVRVMARLPGQRVLILVSPGFLTLSPETMALKSQILDSAAASGLVVNAMDARGLYSSNVDASRQGSLSMLALKTAQPVQDRAASMLASEDTMSELAAGTGGTYFHNNNDLRRGLETLTAAPENLYLLEVSLKDVKADGAYHRLTVKVDKTGLKVVARKGYAAPKAARP